MSKQNPLPGAKPTHEESLYLKTAYEQPVESLGRLEDTARFLVTVATSASAVFLAALKLSSGDGEILDAWWFVPFALWAASVACLVIVLVPRNYAHGQNEPHDIRKTVLRIQRFKYRWLVVGAASFVAGIIVAAVLTICPIG